MAILILEDDADRTTRMKRVLAEVAPSFQVHWWRDANLMEQDLHSLLATAALISLDHDLAADPANADPGDGLQIAKALANHPYATKPPPPVVVHSSNGERAAMMFHLLREAQWRVKRVPPLGEDWIETDWRHTISALLAKT